MTRSEAMILLLGLTGLVLAGWLLLAQRHHDKAAEMALPSNASWFEKQVKHNDRKAV